MSVSLTPPPRGEGSRSGPGQSLISTIALFVHEFTAAGGVPVASVKRGTGRSRGRPRGSGLRSRGPASIQRSLVAAEEAAATAAKTAAYAAYGYSFNSKLDMFCCTELVLDDPSKFLVLPLY